jgi:hypothetical protein
MERQLIVHPHFLHLTTQATGTPKFRPVIPAMIGEQTTNVTRSRKCVSFVAVHSRFACSLSPWCLGFLFCARDRHPLTACAFHFVGDFRCFADALPPAPSLVAYRFASLGNPYRSASVAVSVDPVGKWARKPRRNRAVPRRIPAPLSGQACLSRHFRQRPHHRRGNRLRGKSGVLHSTSMDQPARSPLTAFIELTLTVQAARVLLGAH